MVEGSTLLDKTAELAILVHQGLEPAAGVVWEIVACRQEKSAFLTHLLLWSASSTLVVCSIDLTKIIGHVMKLLHGNFCAEKSLGIALHRVYT